MKEILEMFKYNECAFVTVFMIVIWGIVWTIQALGDSLGKIIHGLPPTQCKLPDEILEDLKDD